MIILQQNNQEKRDETPPISLWPALPNAQNSSGQMISHFPAIPPHFPSGLPSHFPFYEMNPMMGGPVFAFEPHEDSASITQSQPKEDYQTNIWYNHP